MEDDKETAKLQSMMEVIPDEEEVVVNARPLATKPPSIVDWKIIKEGKIGYYQIIRADGNSKRYSSMIQMLKFFYREDLETLWKLVKVKHGYTRPEEGYERVLWGDLKTIYGITSEEQGHAWLRFDTQDYTEEEIRDFETQLGKLRMEHTDAEGQVLFTNYAWRALFGIRGPLVREFMVVLGLHIVEEMETDGFRAYWHASLRVIASKAELRDYWTGISSNGDFLTIIPSYTLIREPLRRLCHRLIAFTIAGRGQAPKKVTTTDLFYLRSMDEGTVVNVPYLLAHYLFSHASGRKYGARMSGGHFIARLGMHSRVITEESLQTLTAEGRAAAGAAQGDHEALEVVAVGQEDVQPGPAP
ncbi:hypothetical protein Tco_0058468 [Tanacetum coccineum]